MAELKSTTWIALNRTLKAEQVLSNDAVISVWFDAVVAAEFTENSFITRNHNAWLFQRAQRTLAIHLVKPGSPFTAENCTSAVEFCSVNYNFNQIKTVESVCNRVMFEVTTPSPPDWA